MPGSGRCDCFPDRAPATVEPGTFDNKGNHMEHEIKLAKHLRVGDVLITKAGHEAEIVMADRVHDRGVTPKQVVMAVTYRIPMDPGFLTACFKLRYPVKVSLRKVEQEPTLREKIRSIGSGKVS